MPIRKTTTSTNNIRQSLNELHSATIDTQAAITDLLERQTPQRWTALHASLDKQTALVNWMLNLRVREQKSRLL